MSAREPGLDELGPDRGHGPAHDLVRGLLEPLLEARTRPAGEQFDRAVAAALGSGRITAELARELRFWQRASVHEIEDQVRSVLPAVLPTALAALARAADEACAATDSARDAWAARSTSGSAEPVSGEPVSAEPATTEAATADADTAEPDSADPVSADDSAESSADDNTSNEGQAPAAHDGAATNPHLRRRLFVAGLTSTA